MAVWIILVPELPVMHSDCFFKSWICPGSCFRSLFNQQFQKLIASLCQLGLIEWQTIIIRTLHAKPITGENLKTSIANQRFPIPSLPDIY